MIKINRCFYVTYIGKLHRKTGNPILLLVYIINVTVLGEMPAHLKAPAIYHRFIFLNTSY